MNRLVLRAVLAQRGSVRYTPAGLPALDLGLDHESLVSQEGQARKVSLGIKAVAIGSLVDSVGRLELGSAAVFAGFLATSRNGRGLTFHLTELQD